MRSWIKKGFALLIMGVLTIVLMLPTAADSIRYEYPETEEEKIVSPSAMLMYIGVKADQDVILYEKDVDTPYQPGGLMRVAMIGYAMKLITDNNVDMDVTNGSYTLEMFNHYVSGTGLHVALMNFGETWTVRDLLTICTLQTAADCAVTLATVLAGSPEQFVDGLNGFAQELGCQNSHFTNVMGLNEDGQYMSARDVMTFTRYALEYAEIKNMLELEQYTVKPISGGKTRSWPTGNDMIRESTEHFYAYADGGKTGGTLTETSLVEYGGKDGYEYMAVVMGAPRKDDKGNVIGTGYADARRLIRWGLLNFTYEMLARKDEPVGRLSVKDCAARYSVSLVPVRDLSTVISQEMDKTKITRKVVCEQQELVAPIKKGETLGNLELYYDGKLIGSVTVAAGEDAPYSFPFAVWSRIKAVLFSGWFLLFLVLLILLCIGYVILNIRYNRKRRRKWKA